MSQAPPGCTRRWVQRPRRLTASDLRNTLNWLLGEHAVLAMNATNLGVTGSKSFPAAAKALDRNSVALSQAIGSIYGAKAAKIVPRRSSSGGRTSGSSSTIRWRSRRRT